MEVESIAARLMLDKKEEKLAQSPVDHNVYTLGSINGHNVVIASLPSTGNTSAATVITQLRNTFKQIRFGLLVGIGGGVPIRTDNGPIHLGDVVVSKPERDHSGAIQYDHGKALEGCFRRTGYLIPPPTVLLNAAQDLSTEQATREDDLVVPHLQRIKTSLPILRKYKYPGPDKDHLYKSDYLHRVEGSSCRSCTCDPLQRIDRRADESLDEIHYDRSSRIVVHRGTIAAGERVIRDGQLRDALAGEHGALCFEMEAAGVMNDFPCLVIRGISDYADSHKNDAWQGYASASAAAYARQLFFHMPVDEVKQCAVGLAGVIDELRNVTGTIKHTAERQHKHNQWQQQHTQKQDIRYEGDRHRQCHQAFKICSYELQKNINPKPVSGTCQWVLTHDQYQKWYRNQHSDLLWVSADPGCGKSVFARKLVDQDLQNGSAHTVCYFFFKDNDDQNNLSKALCSILHQLFASHPELIEYALQAWDKHGETIRSEQEELWRILLRAASDPRSCKVVCIFDALDECRKDQGERFISMLSEFYQSIHSNSLKEGCLKILVTSRPYDDIRDGFQKIPSSLPTIHLRGDDMNDVINQEINLVIRARVAELGKNLKLPETTKQELEEKLLRMEHRTYLWLYLAIQEIETVYADSLRPEEESIDSLPSSVEHAYVKILERVRPEQEESAKRILQIVVGARRPLTTRELANALNVTMEPDRLKEKIRRLCGLFIFFNNSKAYLIHQTAKEFLVGSSITGNPRWKHCFSPTETERLMAQICISCLVANNLDEGGTNETHARHSSALSKSNQFDLEDPAIEEYKMKHSLLEYSANHWISHVQMGNIVDSGLIVSVAELCNIGDASSCIWFRVYSASINRSELRRNSRLHRPKTGLRWAVELGVVVAARRHLDANDSASRNIEDIGAVFLAAIENRSFGGTLTALLLDFIDDSIKITKEVVVAAAGNWGNGKNVMTLLLDRRAADVQITQEVVVAAAKNGGNGKDIMTLLLDRRAADVQITQEVVVAAAGNRGNGKDIMTLLLDRRAADVQITQEVVVAAAGNWSNGKDIMTLLLDRRAANVQITQEVVVAAAGNRWNGKNIIAVLRRYNVSGN
ncbi:hypothetical protein AA0121_g13297 [Alternaria tenuissima]|nr:hypothetical protein AA0121_g13297 [Alternaria tenuissima]